MKQSEIVKQLTDKELTKQLIFSQLLLLLLSILLSFLLFDNIAGWLDYFSLDMRDFFYYGVLTGIVIVVLDLMLMYIFPKKYYDDGGINDRIFKNRSIKGIFGIALLVAITEELLFRGLIQASFGYVAASTLFALVHIRYLKKPVLLVSVLVVSFYIGYIFVLTENLVVTIIAHFTVDFVLGMIIRFQK
ncbi:CPBP family intramembrane metalloprotease [Lentibacillus salicampi]|uniref:CPBP family intramembrane metalloprotease n=1 Tax=Lentibacillus salicampi TaxID=175306 RepID=A0A4Y9AD28_9BACI|nr:CPBP family intramembrane glutamic endopeptidase [Lentibacillus salicampi]TFJ93789.1 CPBP family intramembrane metalloprotease [Lentibacillus salicampi]